MSGQRRKDMGGMLRAVALGGAMLAVAGCTPLYRDHGYAPSETELSQISVGVDTRESVAESVGTPSSAGVLQNSGYYYVSQRMRTFAYQAPEIVNREVVAISFDSRGVVRNIERFGLREGNVVALSRRVTDSSVQGVGFLSQLFGNVGSLDIGSNL